MGLGQLFTRSAPVTVRDPSYRVISAGDVAFPTIMDEQTGSWPTENYAGGMTIPAAWRGANLISDLLGQVPWDAYRKQPGTRLLELIPNRPMLLEQPDPPNVRMTSFASWGLDLIWNGNAIGVISSRNAQNYPTSAIFVPASWVGVRRVNEPGMGSELPVGALEYKVGTLSLGSQDVIHIKGPGPPSALRGWGVVEKHFNLMRLSQEQGKQARGLSAHGVPTGILRSLNPDLTRVQARRLKANWLESQTTRTIAVLNASTEFQSLAWNPEQMQLVEARTFTLTEWELVFGLPPGWLGGMNSARQYSNIEQDAVNLLKFTMGGHVARFEQTLSLCFPRNVLVQAELDAILRADTLTRYQAYEIAVNTGFMVNDEVREREGRRPLPEPEPAPTPEPSTNPEGVSRETEEGLPALPPLPE